MPLCASVYMCLVITCWERLTSWFLVYNCEFVIFPLVSWVRCGTGLYRDLCTLTYFKQLLYLTTNSECLWYNLGNIQVAIIAGVLIGLSSAERHII